MVRATVDSTLAIPVLANISYNILFPGAEISRPDPLEGRVTCEGFNNFRGIHFPHRGPLRLNE